MESLTRADRDRINGVAAFATAAGVVAAGVIAALERVGASDGFVESLGPMFAFSAVSAFGLANRAATLTDFLAARRAIPGLYAGLALVAIWGGVSLALMQGRTASEMPWPALAIGGLVAGLIVAPWVRRAHVSSPMDVLATRFSAPPVRFALGCGLFVCGALTAAAGYQLAAQSLSAALGGAPRAGAAFAGCALAFTLLPGGAKSAGWADAASGGGALLILAIGAACAWFASPDPTAPLLSGFAGLQAEAGVARSDLALEAAVAVALAFFFPLLQPGLMTPSVGEARRAGFAGLMFCALGVGAAALALPLFANAPPTARHAGQALLSAAAWLPSLALARAGALAASRAFGIDLRRAYSGLTVLSSRRIAVGRIALLLMIALMVFAPSRFAITADRALMLAMAFSLALLTPSLVLALALPARASAASALAALLAAGAELGVQARFDPGGFAGFGVVIESLTAASAALALGAFAALMFPARNGKSAVPTADLFVDLPFDPVSDVAGVAAPAFSKRRKSSGYI